MMADVFVEHMVAKSKTASDKLIMFLYVLAFIFLNVVLMLIEVLVFLIPMGLIGGCWLLMRLRRNQGIEFEYILTNGIIDIDKIIGKRKRKRLASLDCRNFEIIAPLNSSYFKEYEKAPFAKKLDASSGTNDSRRCFAVCPAKEGGRMLFVFEPNDRMREIFKMYAPRAVKL